MSLKRLVVRQKGKGERMASKELIESVQNYEDYIKLKGLDEQVLDAYSQAVEVAFEAERDYMFGYGLAKRCKGLINKFCIDNTQGDIWALERYAQDNEKHYVVIDYFYKVLKQEARALCLDSYLLYVEHKRSYKDRFYLPKRKCFLKIGLVQALQDMIDDNLDLLTISLPPGTGKTTIEKFFHSALCGWFPKDYSLFYSHSGAITRMYYDGVLNILTDSEYAWGEIFPEQMVTSTNAASEQINIGAYKPFPNLQTASVGGSNAGKVRCNLYLLVDDMISSIEEATNKPLLDKRWQQYTVDARQRKKGKCKEIHIATRWSVHDIIGRLQRANGSRRRARFISIPDVDETTGESNFNFDIDPFTTEFFSEQARLMDNVSYRCLYKNDPIEREGLLYHEEDFKYYLELPDSEPEAVWGEGDTKTSGTDYMVLPCFRQYGDMYYLSSTICDNGSDFAIQEGRIVDLMLRENMQMCEIEANAGGTRLALNVQAKVKELGGRCTITTKYTETNKETRIIVNAPWIKEHVILPDKSLYPYDSDMGRFIRLLFGYTMNGKKQLDDVPDCLANFALNQTKMTRHTATFTPIANPFRTNRR